MARPGKNSRRLWTVLAAILMLPASNSGWAGEDLGIVESQAARFRIDVVARGLEIPSSMAFLPDGRALATERRLRRITLIDLASGKITPLSGLPAGFGPIGDGITAKEGMEQPLYYYVPSIAPAAWNSIPATRSRGGREYLSRRPGIQASEPSGHQG